MKPRMAIRFENAVVLGESRIRAVLFELDCDLNGSENPPAKSLFDIIEAETMRKLKRLTWHLHEFQFEDRKEFDTLWKAAENDFMGVEA